MLALSACTTNNGDIGPWFGTWKVTEIRCDGAVDEQYAGNIFFKFQSSVFAVVVTYDNHINGTSIGSWREDGDGSLVVWFPDDRYTLEQATHLTREENIFSYETVKSSGFTLTLNASDGHTYTYRLVKW